MSKKINFLFWIYSGILLTFNELLGLFMPKMIWRVGYFFLMALYFAYSIFSQGLEIRLRKKDCLVLCYFLCNIFRGIIQYVCNDSNAASMICFVQMCLPVLAYFMAININDKQAEKIEFIYVLFAVLSTFMGMVDSKIKFLPSKGAFAGKLYAYVGNGSVALRGYSMAGSALSTGYICALAFCFLMGLRRINPRVKIILLVSCFLGCAISLSRGAIGFLAITVSLYILGKIQKSNKRISRKQFYIIMSLILISIGLVVINWDRILNSNTFNRIFVLGASMSDGSNSSRFTFQINAIKEILRHPLWGKGFGYSGYQASLSAVEGFVNTESYILSLGISMGLVGMFLFLLISILTVVKIFKQSANVGNRYADIILGILVWCFMYILLESDINALFYWYCIGRLNTKESCEKR